MDGRLCRRKDVFMKTQIFLSGKRTTALLIGLALLSAVSGCGKTSQINDSAAVPANAPVSDSGTDAPADSSADSEADSNTDANGDTSIHVVAVGDNLVQQCVYQSAQAHSQDGTSYNFDYCYDNIKPLINGDLNIINQETLICGDGFEVSGSTSTRLQNWVTLWSAWGSTSSPCATTTCWTRAKAA